MLLPSLIRLIRWISFDFFIDILFKFINFYYPKIYAILRSTYLKYLINCYESLLIKLIKIALFHPISLLNLPTKYQKYVNFQQFFLSILCFIFLKDQLNPSNGFSFLIVL